MFSASPSTNEERTNDGQQTQTSSLQEKTSFRREWLRLGLDLYPDNVKLYEKCRAKSTERNSLVSVSLGGMVHVVCQENCTVALSAVGCGRGKDMGWCASTIVVRL